MIKACLIGQNIKNSRSKEMYKKFSQAQNIEFNYENFDIRPNDLPEFIDYAAKNLKGFNVTHPYKKLVMNYLYEIDDVSQTVEAVNTVIVRNGRLFGYNTDEYGAKKAYSDFFQDGNILVLGRGGAARAIVYAFRDRDITIYARDDKNDWMYKIKPDLKVITSFTNCDFENVINATNVGFNERKTILNFKFKSQKTAADVIYTPDETLYLNLMKSQGIKIKNGIDMLYYQAEKAYKLFKGDEIG